MKNRYLFATVVLLLLLPSFPAWTQTGTVPVKGVVIGLDSKPLAGADMEFLSLETGRKFNMKTGKDGKFLTIGVLTGDYQVTISKDGKAIEQDKVTVNIDESMDDFKFDLAKSHAAVITPEEKARQEANQKIQGLNKLLLDSAAARKEGNFDDAIKIMSQATQQDATKDLLWASLGESYLGAAKHNTDRSAANNEYQQAADAYKKAIDLKPSGLYYNNLGESYGKLGKTQDAIDSYKKATELDPANAYRYYFNLGAVLTNTGKPDEANDAFNKAIAAKPDYAEAYYQRSINLLQKATVDPKTGAMKTDPEVAAGFNKYLELEPTGPHAQESKDMLAQLGEKVETGFGKTKKK